MTTAAGPGAYPRPRRERYRLGAGGGTIAEIIFDWLDDVFKKDQKEGTKQLTPQAQ
jgi:hypothetical protein